MVRGKYTRSRRREGGTRYFPGPAEDLAHRPPRLRGGLRGPGPAAAACPPPPAVEARGQGPRRRPGPPPGRPRRRGHGAELPEGMAKLEEEAGAELLPTPFTRVDGGCVAV